MSNHRLWQAIYPNILYECINFHNPSDESVREQTRKYIHEDYIRNSHLYSERDKDRIANYLLTEYQLILE